LLPALKRDSGVTMKFRKFQLAVRAAPLVVCAAALFVIAGCANHATVLQAGAARPAISPSEVKVYLTAPPNYEAIAMLNASDSSHWMSNQRLQKRVLRDITAKAAKVGANGVLITHTGSGEVAGNSVALIGSLSSDAQSITALAIYVPRG
jgi:hypothetical protein